MTKGKGNVSTPKSDRVLRSKGTWEEVAGAGDLDLIKGGCYGCSSFGCCTLEAMKTHWKERGHTMVSHPTHPITGQMMETQATLQQLKAIDLEEKIEELTGVVKMQGQLLASILAKLGPRTSASPPPHLFCSFWCPSPARLAGIEAPSPSPYPPSTLSESRSLDSQLSTGSENSFSGHSQPSHVSTPRTSSLSDYTSDDTILRERKRRKREAPARPA
ncbi:MAG: hypothetical protein J3Q66DRAFT_390904, partial [Benniella sp.]